MPLMAVNCGRPAGGAGTSPRSPAAPECLAPARRRNLPERQTPRPPTADKKKVPHKKRVNR